jgi:hypothetical protein
MDTLPAHIKKAIQYGIPLHDVIQGAIMDSMVELQDKEFKDKQYSKGYGDALSDIYSMCYDLIFYKMDVEAGN